MTAEGARSAADIANSRDCRASQSYFQTNAAPSLLPSPQSLAARAGLLPHPRGEQHCRADR